MIENSINSNQLNIINISRNTPIGLVVGAAGFIGSHLVDKLLDHNIQVIGVDNFISGSKSNLEKAIRNKNFHLFNISAQNLKLDVTRLDYIYIAATDKYSFDEIFKIAHKFKPKIVFISSIDLYDPKMAAKLNWYKNAELELARFAKAENINIRIVRLAEVYGERMHFRNEDPVTRLIQASLLNELQNETTVLNFSTRALYIEDAVSLIIKSVMSGATALRIFDGCLPSPVKVSEIKQILIDPLWYETRNFVPTELPPWSTPNLEKTIKLLSWQPKTNLIKGLKNTLEYFQENEIAIDEVKTDKGWGADDWEQKAKVWREQFISPDQKKQPEVEEQVESEIDKSEQEPEQDKKEFKKPKIKRPRKRWESIALTSVAVFLIFYAFVYPVISLGWGIFTFRQNLQNASNYLSKGDFEKSLGSIKNAENSVGRAEEFVQSVEIIRKMGIFSKEFVAVDGYIDIGKEVSQAAAHAILGTQAMFEAIKTISGESTGDPKSYLTDAGSQLDAADIGFSGASLKLENPSLTDGFFTQFKNEKSKIDERVQTYANLIKQAKSATFLLPQVIALEGKKSYLVLLQNNNELRPTGGFIGSIARVDFEGGKLKKLEVQDVYAIDGQLSFHVEPPKDIKDDLGQKDWYLRDSNYEPDFPTSARQAAWFYTKVTGLKLDGVVAINLSAMESLLTVLGPLELTDYNETITSSNLFERSIAHAEQNFFAGSQAKKNFISALSTQVFNKIFFLPKQNWPGIVKSLGKSFDEKQLLVYLADPKLFSYLASENFAGAMPRQGVFKEGQIDDFLSVVEANLGANKSNYYLDRNIKIETGIGKEGEVNNRVRISYVNRSPSAVWPGGAYKDRMRIYLPFGARIIKAQWGEKDITSDVNTFVDYGRSAYSVLLSLAPKEQKTLIFDYQLANKVSFKDGKAVYNLDVIKQPGTIHDPLEWRIIYPISYKISSPGTEEAGPQERVISTDLSKDRRFEAEFKQ